MLPDGDFKRMLGQIAAHFKARGCTQEVSGELTTQVFVINGVTCQMEVTVKVWPVTEAAVQR